MKKIFTLLMAFTVTTLMFSQVPQKMSYQAVIRNAGNSLIVNHAVGMRISILQGSATGNPVYVETQTPTTNGNGLATLQIGEGVVVSGSISSIDWSNGPFFLKTETDPAGGTSYSIAGTSQLLSVPYALYAGSVVMRTSLTGDTLFTGSGNYIIVPGISTANSNSLVFTQNISGYEQIFVANSDFSTVKQLTNGTIHCSHPRISPDGKKIVYDKGSGNNYDIWVMNIDGSNNYKVTNTNVINLLPAWHNNGKEIIYEYGTTANTKVVAKIIRINGTNDRVLVDVGNKVRFPCMNPADSNFVSFYYDSGNWAYSSSIRIRNLTAGTDETIVSSDGTYAKDLPTYSHNGQYLIWFDNSPTVKKLMTINLTTKNKTTIESISNSNAVLYGVYSTDDNYLYHLRRVSTAATEVVRRNADGSNPVTLFTGDNINWIDTK